MKNLTIEEHGEFYYLIGKELGLEFNYSGDYNAYVVPKKEDDLHEMIKNIEAVSQNMLSAKVFEHKNRSFVSGTMVGSYENGTISKWLRVFKTN